MKRKIYLLILITILIMCCASACNKHRQNSDSSVNNTAKNIENTEKSTTSDYNTTDDSWKLSGVTKYNDDNLVMYCGQLGFINKDGKVFRIGDNQICDFKFNTSVVWNEYNSYEQTGLYGEHVVAVVYDSVENKTRLYYLDSCIEPVLLSTQDNVYLYNVINKSDISADGKWVLYLDNYKSSGDMGRNDNFDLHLYNVDNRSDTIIATDIQDAKFTLDGKHLVYCKMPQDYVDNGNTNNKKFTIVDLKTMNESKTYAEADYGDNIDFTGLWAIKDNGDILIFNGMPGTGYYAHAVYLIRNDKLQVLLNFDSDSYGIVTNKELNDMFVIKNNNIYYYDIDNMKNVELGEDYRISIPILSKRRNFLYNIDSLDKMVFASEDGVYLWNKAELKLEKVLSMDWHSGEIIVIDYSDSDMLIAFDKSKICRVENLSNKPLITTLFSTSEGIIEDIMYDISAYQPTDDNIWFTVEENEDYIFYAIDKNGNILHKVSGELIDDLDIGSIGYIPSASQYTLMAYNYNDEEHLYSVDSDVREVKLIENRAIKHTYCDNSLWTVYMVTDGMVCMYNGEKVINIGMPELD